MNYSLPLADVVPELSGFTVMVNSSFRTINFVTISGSKVILTLSSPVEFGDEVTVSYTPPSSNPLQTPSGGLASSLVNGLVTNNIEPPTPVLLSSVIENAAPSIIELTYDLPLANIVPPTNAFAVMVNSVSRIITIVGISGTKVQLTLSSPTVYGDDVTVAYTKPATTQIQSISGGRADSFGAQQVINNINQVTSGIVFNPNKTYGSVSDIDGNTYKTIVIGTQTWMAENLKTTKFNTGEEIPLNTNDTTWLALSTPAYCWYDNNISNKNIYGALYNYFVVKTEKICPVGWHIANQEEWDIMVSNTLDAGNVKETGTSHWQSPNEGATNESGFSGVPAGARVGSHYYNDILIAEYYGLGIKVWWWSSTLLEASSVFVTYLKVNENTYQTTSTAEIHCGISIRCLKND